MCATTISCSDGTTLRFEDSQLLAEHKAAIAKVEMSSYKKIRAKYGVWASNQYKFVPSVEDLNKWDSRTMENRLADET